MIWDQDQRTQRGTQAEVLKEEAIKYRKIYFNLLNPMPPPPGKKHNNIQETVSQGFLTYNNLLMCHTHLTGRNSANWWYKQFLSKQNRTLAKEC